MRRFLSSLTAIQSSSSRSGAARAATVLAALLTLAPIAWTLNCGGGGGGDTQPETDSSVDDSTTETAVDGGGDVASDSDAPPPTDTGKADVGGDTSPPPVTCTKAPSFAAPLKLSHNPDALRTVANASMALLPDGRLMVVWLEALDTGSRFGLFARIVDPVPDGGKFGPDERLDVDADNLTASSPLILSRLPNGALALQVIPGAGQQRARVYSHGKWSPELGGAMPITDTDKLIATDSPNGQVLVWRTHAATPSATAVVYRPDEGGAFGSWSSVQTLDLDGGSGVPSVQGFSLPDGRFYVAVWHGGGGPSIRVRTASGAWSVPSLKAEIGPTPDGAPQLRKLDDGTLVLVALEGTGDTRRAVTSTWNPVDSTWSTARLLSKTTDANGVIPYVSTTPDPFLFRVSESELEFVAWVAGCTGAAKDCEFHPISRRYKAGAWTDPVDLLVGTPVNGPKGLSTVDVSGSPVVVRADDLGLTLMRARIGNVATFAPLVSMFDGSPFFTVGRTRTVTSFFGGTQGLWALTGRTDAPSGGPSTNIASVITKVDPTAGPPTNWTAVMVDTSAEMHGTGYAGAFADGLGGFGLAVNDAFDGSTRVPILAHAIGTSGTADIQRVKLSDETSAYFSNAPRFAPRPGGVDKSAIFVVMAAVSTGNRMRAYAWNGVGGTKAGAIAAENRGPKPFGDGLLTFGCGGAILYGVDGTDGSHAVEMVLVQ